MNASNFDMFFRCGDAVDIFGGSDDSPSPAAGEADAPGAEAGYSLTALLTVLIAPRRSGCAVGFFVLNACDVQPGVGDGVEGGVERMVFVRELIEDAEFAQHRNALRFGAGEQDAGAPAFETPSSPPVKRGQM
ncbi:hypothetical protein [uncultured Tessaracoccus sp.]|uniref:hypothetical protein n=1 Tax=uncultured Tessaracoccus sp. TaxID=905023 RepID=UPI00263248EF|nr:hypothetical protein [uncultured Tessaracoccus sp.]